MKAATTEIAPLDRMFQRITHALVATGPPLHYAELAGALGLSVEKSRRQLRTLMQAYPVGWLHPDTGYIDGQATAALPPDTDR